MLYEKKLIDKQTVEFFKCVHKQRAFYRCKDFERDYKIQAFNQKFMRQVSYKRPKNWVDPFPDPPAGETDEQRKERYRAMRIKARAVDLRPGAKTKPPRTPLRQHSRRAGHINRLKQFKEGELNGHGHGRRGGEREDAMSTSVNSKRSGKGGDGGEGDDAMSFVVGREAYESGTAFIDAGDENRGPNNGDNNEVHTCMRVI